MSEYEDFLERRSQQGAASGFAPVWMPDYLFDFQVSLTDWLIRQGRAAGFADCGLGKTIMELVWSENVVRKTNGSVLLVTPLAVAAQTVSEGVKFGIAATRSMDGRVPPGATVVVTNYDRLHLFNPHDFKGVAFDESSILKNFDGSTRAMVTDFSRKIPYRLLATATAAPNDFVELGTSSEALGYLGYMDMLNMFFKNDQNTSHAVRYWSGSKWRFKGHAREHFWRWVCSWARAIRRPSDLGFDDRDFVLPPLIENEHLVEARTLAPGMLFALPAQGLWEEREEQKRTVEERCEKAASLVNDTGQPAVCWCHLNIEGDRLTRMIPDAVQVSGSDSMERKEEIFEAFSSGQVRVLVIKPKIGALGLNWQHCAHMTIFPSHSFEQLYQGERRCWRFGQKRPVVVDIIATDSGLSVLKNLQRKARQADEMFTELVQHMNNALRINRIATTIPAEVPSWLTA